jgi:uncharacterized membrane protein
VRSEDGALESLERTLGRLLRGGVLSAAVLLAFGLVVSIAAGATPLSAGTLTAGLIVLMATPILRVVVSLVAYARMRDWFFVATTVSVFVLLAVTVLLAWSKLSRG